MKASTFAAAMAVLLLHTCVSCSRKGTGCETDGVKGICLGVTSCPSVFEQFYKGMNPTVCSIEEEIIVCCLDSSVWRQMSWKYPKAPVAFVSDDPCEPIPFSEAVSKTGQKALDKCLEYQEMLVFPCEESLALAGRRKRANRCNWKPEKLIVDGESAYTGEFPHLALLGYGDVNPVWLSAGSLLSERFVLTSGHCISSAWRGPVRKITIGVRRRSEITSTSSKIYDVWKTYTHPKYQSPLKYHDIALLETDRRMHLDRFAVPACLPTGGRVDDAEVDVAGWGDTSYGSRVMSDALQKVTLTKFTDEECSDKLKGVRLLPNGFDPVTQICYGDRTSGKDSCSGDSGGSAVVKHPDVYCMYYLLGVISWSKKCGVPNVPGVYIRVEPYVPWIVSIVWPDEPKSSG